MRMNYLIFDPIDFRGGSKVAIEAVFDDHPQNKSHALVLSNDAHSWSSDIFHNNTFWFPEILHSCVHGLPFICKHIIYAFTIMLHLMKRSDIKVLVATSGPGIDLGLYLARWIMHPLKQYTLIQFVQGPVAESRISALCLTKADKIFYLENTMDSLNKVTQKIMEPERIENNPKYEVLSNGLASKFWPSKATHNEMRILWAASNLQWKGLDHMVNALQSLNQEQIKVACDICYIRADNQGMAVSETNIKIPGVTWHEMPSNLDELRQKASIFVSTSTMEPFGLSILEALAAGLCVIIPADGAYWDQRLRDGVDCIKYEPNNAVDLTVVIESLINEPMKTKAIGNAALQIAKTYQATRRYRNVHRSLELGVSNVS